MTSMCFWDSVYLEYVSHKLMELRSAYKSTSLRNVDQPYSISSVFSRENHNVLSRWLYCDVYTNIVCLVTSDLGYDSVSTLSLEHTAVDGCMMWLNQCPGVAHSEWDKTNTGSDRFE